MKVDGRPYRTIWLAEDGWSVEILDQTRLPHRFAVERLQGLDAAARAIRTMQVRGAPLIGVTAAYGVALAMTEDPSDAGLARACDLLLATRPTAVNLRWALEGMRRLLQPLGDKARRQAAYARAGSLAEEDVALCRAIGGHGLALIAAAAARRPGERVRVL
ncbi:MAG: S-methyl-5-thioribose-1-phosphate isomerase, partial [Tistlia sp.]